MSDKCLDLETTCLFFLFFQTCVEFHLYLREEKIEIIITIKKKSKMLKVKKQEKEAYNSISEWLPRLSILLLFTAFHQKVETGRSFIHPRDFSIWTLKYMVELYVRIHIFLPLLLYPSSPAAHNIFKCKMHCALVYYYIALFIFDAIC